jgi:hypothetical protein
VSGGIQGDLDNRPAIGSTLAGDRYLLVLFRKNSTGTDILASLRSTSGTSFASTFVGPLLSSSQGTMVPGDVSVAASLADKWIVVWRECSDTTCASQLVRMQALVSNGGGSPLAADPAVTLATETSADTVRVAGHGGNWLAVWRAFSSFTNSSDVHGVPLGLVGGLPAPLGPVQNLTTQEPNVTATREHVQPSVAYDGVRFAYGYLENVGGGLLLPFAATVFAAGPTLTWHEGHAALSVLTASSCRTFDLGDSGPGSLLGRHWAIWQQDSTGVDGDLHGAIYDARRAGPTSVVTQTGCGAPTEPTIALSGTPALGRSFTVTLGNIPVFPVLMVGPENVNLLPGCNGCMTGVDVATMQLFATSSLTVAVPANPALIQFRLAFQGLSGLQPGGCPASFVGFAFALSDTLTIQVM